jgi:DNA-binding transcriptional MerR regulator/effector-binding domain-containing protein
MLSIGEFSRVSRITIKALRHYHEQGLLVPELVDEDTGYRYYGTASRQRAAAILVLKDMGFSLSEIGSLLESASDDADLSEALGQKLKEIETGIKEQRARQRRIREFLETLGQTAEMSPPDKEIKDIEVPETLVFGLRHRGRSDEIGRLIGQLFRKAGRYTVGGPFCLYYDGDYKEDDADFEVCAPAKRRMGIEGIDCRMLTGGRAATLVHCGPYRSLGVSYERLFDHVRRSGFSVAFPIREEYLKGPGMVVRGDPAKYRTRLMIFHGPGM